MCYLGVHNGHDIESWGKSLIKSERKPEELQGLEASFPGDFHTGRIDFTYKVLPFKGIR